MPVYLLCPASLRSCSSRSPKLRSVSTSVRRSGLPMLRELGRIAACLICSVVLVLFVPSSAWSGSTDTAGSGEQPSSSPASESASPSVEPQPSDVPSLSPSGSESSSSDPAPAPATESTAVDEPSPPAPTVTETVTAEPEPVPAALEAETTDPVIVRLDDETTALLLLTAALVALGVGARVVGSFGGR